MSTPLLFLKPIILWRAQDMYGAIQEFLPRNKHSALLDLGTGLGGMREALSLHGFTATSGVDIKHQDVFGREVVISQENRLPFANKSFQGTLILTVLHHTPPAVQKQLLLEAKRVSKEVLVMEDIVTSPTQRLATYIMDSVLNCELFNHPHSNRTDPEWRSFFQELGFKVVKVKKRRFWLLFVSGVYYLRS